MSRVQLRSLTSVFALGLLALFLVSCDGGIGDFGDTNEDPTVPDNIEPANEFTSIQLGVAGSRYEMWRANLIYAECIVQHTARTAGYWQGNFYGFHRGYLGSLWNTRYAGGPNEAPWLAAIKSVENLIRRLEDNEENANRIAAARIIRAFSYHRMTDAYGGIPYSEGASATEGVLKPHFTRQDSVYMDLGNELMGAADQLDASKPTYKGADLIFNGDVDKWRKFANSLLLRLALRQVKVDPSRAESWAQEAINGGVMAGPADDAVIPHQSGPSDGLGYNTNANNEVMTGFGDTPKLSDTFVDWLKDGNDPRLSVLADQNASGSFVGLPNGFLADELANDPNLANDPAEYSPVGSSLLDLSDPIFLQRSAEVQLMLAEAEVRWGITSKSAQEHYETGVRHAMQSLSKYGDGAEIPQSDIDQYVNNELESLTGNQAEDLKLINNQYWAATFLNGLEAWANWRRSGYPDFEPADEEGVTQGEPIRRYAYPLNEEQQNRDNYDEARDRQGISQGNELTARVWWDCGEVADQCNTSGLGPQADPSNTN